MLGKRIQRLIQGRERGGRLTERLLGQTSNAAPQRDRKDIVGWGMRDEILGAGQCPFRLANQYLGLSDERLRLEEKATARRHLAAVFLRHRLRVLHRLVRGTGPFRQWPPG